MTEITADSTGYSGNRMTITTNNGLTILVDGDAFLTNRVFPGWWGDVAEGEEYVSEWSDIGHDQDGNEYGIIWRFTAVRGEEPDDAGDWPWDDPVCITNIIAR